MPQHPDKEPISSPHGFDWDQFTQPVSPWLSLHPLALLWELFLKCRGLLDSAGEVRHRKHHVPLCSDHMLNLLPHFQPCAAGTAIGHFLVTFDITLLFLGILFKSELQLSSAIPQTEWTVFPNSSFCSCHLFHLLCSLFPLELCHGLPAQAGENSLLTHLPLFLAVGKQRMLYVFCDSLGSQGTVS